MKRRVIMRLATFVLSGVSALTLYSWSGTNPNANQNLALFMLICVLYVDFVFLIDGFKQGEPPKPTYYATRGRNEKSKRHIN